ncbi:dinitrogenase iron-molybdenum cofactor [archaeon]|nr:dinitrogenase iron-molybdenum cofactor [archaeon]
MKIAIPIKNNDGMDSVVADHFGRAADFALYDSDTKQLKVIHVDEHKEKQCLPVKKLDEHKPDAMYVFGMGWRAMNLLEQRGIKAKTGNYKTIKQVVEHLGDLKDLQESCSEGH